MLGAAVWVGGQIVVGGLVPTVRRSAPDLTAVIARGFARLAWPAYALLLGTGIWNVSATHAGQSPAWHATLWAKIGVVVVAGISAFAHQRSTGRRGLAVWGAVAGLSSLAALFFGILLAG